MRRIHTALAGVLLLGSIPLTFMAQSALAATGATLSVEALLAMSPSDRKAYLKGLAPSERRGLWFQVKKAQYTQRGATPKESGRNNLNNIA